LVIDRQDRKVYSCTARMLRFTMSVGAVSSIPVSI
jgi:hypothetical protein